VHLRTDGVKYEGEKSLLPLINYVTKISLNRQSSLVISTEQRSARAVHGGRKRRQAQPARANGP
jgi:hypothetical protein